MKSIKENYKIRIKIVRMTTLEEIYFWLCSFFIASGATVSCIPFQGKFNAKKAVTRTKNAS